MLSYSSCKRLGILRKDFRSDGNGLARARRLQLTRQGLRSKALASSPGLRGGALPARRVLPVVHPDDAVVGVPAGICRAARRAMRYHEVEFDGAAGGFRAQQVRLHALACRRARGRRAVAQRAGIEPTPASRCVDQRPNLIAVGDADRGDLRAAPIVAGAGRRGCCDDRADQRGLKPGSHRECPFISRCRRHELDERKARSSEGAAMSASAVAYLTASSMFFLYLSSNEAVEAEDVEHHAHDD